MIHIHIEIDFYVQKYRYAVDSCDKKWAQQYGEPHSPKMGWGRGWGSSPMGQSKLMPVTAIPTQSFAMGNLWDSWAVTAVSAVFTSLKHVSEKKTTSVN